MVASSFPGQPEIRLSGSHHSLATYRAAPLVPNCSSRMVKGQTVEAVPLPGVTTCECEPEDEGKERKEGRKKEQWFSPLSFMTLAVDDYL